MSADYKAHNIHAEASYVPKGWKPHLYVVYSEGVASAHRMEARAFPKQN